MRPRFTKDYVVVMIDTERMTDGAAVARELRKGRSGGIPWMVILDGEGNERITSDGPRGNIGCPVQPHEVEHFLAMIDATRRHMTAADRAVLERELRAYADRLRRGHRDLPGARAYAAALREVRFGRFGAAMAALDRAIEAGLDPSLVLSDPGFWPLREDPERRLELRERIAAHTRASRVAIVDPFEPGRRIRLQGRVVDAASGEPVADALVELFHTDARGEYRPGMDAGGGAGNPRLFGFVRSDRNGRFTVLTILPERYPNSTVPRHVHYRVRAEGYRPLESECFFEGDPRLSERTRARGVPVVRLEEDTGALEVKLVRG